MITTSEVTRFIAAKDIVIPYKTLEQAATEADGYKFQRLGIGIYACVDGDDANIIIEKMSPDTDHDVPVIGCNCLEWAQAQDQDGCKHVATFQNRSRKPTAKPDKRVVMDLIAAGWTKDDRGDIYPPDAELKAIADAERNTELDDVMGSDWNTEHPEGGQVQLFDGEGQESATVPETTSDPDGEDNDGDDPVPPKAEKPEPGMMSAACEWCGELIERKHAMELVGAIEDHKKICPKRPEEQDFQPTPDDSKTETTRPANIPDGSELIATGNPIPIKTNKPKENKNMDETVNKVITEAEAIGAKDIDVKYVEEKLAALKRFKVVGSEAVRSVVSGILRSQGIKRPKGNGGGHKSNELVTVDEIDEADQWINLRVKVVDLWHSEHDSIKQIGLVGDETGVIKFVSWAKADLAEIEKDKCYSIENVVTNEYEERFSVAFTKNTTITEIAEDIVVGFTTSEFTGVMVAVQNGSGLIYRCSICNKAMQKGTCKEHGKVDGVHDLRIKGVLDDGINVQGVLLNRERTEALTGITLEAAVAMAQEALDAEVVAERMQGMLIGQYYTATGQDMGDTILVESIYAIDKPVTKEMIEALLKEA